MANDNVARPAANDIELQEWLESLEWVIENEGADRAVELLQQMQIYAQKHGVDLPFDAKTPYINTIPRDKQPAYPGRREIERRIKSIIRWNAMAMVVRANRKTANMGPVGGHISTFASAATIYEVGFNHFFRAKTDDYGGDLVYFQGHASPGIYARAFVEGRLTEENLNNFRQELQPGGGLSSYPHPWLMPDFWQFPTVSMGLGPIMSIYQARFSRYLEDRGLKPRNGGRIWAFLGDGECDEPETLGAITLAAREKLDNLTFVINCNLQRLDGPVRGNGKIIQELEGAFRGAGWNVIKVIWGNDWDELIERDESGRLVQRMGEVIDGQYQKYTVSTGEYTREHFFNKYPETKELAADLSDEEIRNLRRGGHDPEKVFAAYKNATETPGQPTVILCKTIKGYGLGEAGEGKNVTHNQKKLNEDELREFRTRFGIPISDEDVAEAPFYRPPEDSPEMQYLHERRKSLGGYLPERKMLAQPLERVPYGLFESFYAGSGEREVSTTMSFVNILSKLLKDKEIGKLCVPIVPDEARTFGMDPLFRQCGIYSHVGQLYKPVDSDQFLYYKEATNGQILEEGITEAGSMSSFIAAGTAHANHGINTIPFFIYYSMFGLQRVGDLFWLAGDIRARGFCLGGTAGRTTLNGEGLQHQDGHSHLFASAIPNLLAYDPAWAYEIAVIIKEGIRRMYVEQEDIFYYITLQNENYVMPDMPDGCEEGILKGLYVYQKTKRRKKSLHKVNLFGGGSIMLQVLEAAKYLEDNYDVAVTVWSATSYNELRRDALNCERHNMLHPTDKPQVPYVTEMLNAQPGLTVAASDYVKAGPDGIRQWVPGTFVALGTDGFGRSETRIALRDHFEVDHRFVVVAALYGLSKEGKVKPEVVAKAIKDLDIDPDKINPHTA